MADVTFSSNALIEIDISIKNLFSAYPSAGRNTDLDQTFDCSYTDVHGNEDAGVPEISVSLTGTWLDRLFAGDNSDTIIDIPVTLSTDTAHSAGVHIESDTVIDITLTIVPDDKDVVFELKRNWVAW